MKRSPNVSFSNALRSQMMTSPQYQVTRHESNFVYTSHGLVIELADQTYWFWNSPDDAHGSTLNHLALTHPGSYHRYVTLETADNRAQWTRVLVMPRSVVAANLRNEADSWP